ncbi:MAG: hypothetical protein JNL05_10390 [Flavobacteriales bacterium]|nr:hypothetical protein [Flavobacteriales bacterium]
MRTNAFIQQATEARAYLMRETGLDELDYQLLILESGCQFLEHAVTTTKPKYEALAVKQRRQLMDLGFFNFWQHQVMAHEIATRSRWENSDLWVYQPMEDKRRDFVQRALTMYALDKTWAAFDRWLKQLERRKVRIAIPEIPPSELFS